MGGVICGFEKLFFETQINMVKQCRGTVPWIYLSLTLYDLFTKTFSLPLKTQSHEIHLGRFGPSMVN